MGVDMGKVMEKNFLPAPAPSISAASYSCLGIFLNCANQMMVPPPKLHKFISTMERIAVRFSALKNAEEESPSEIKNWLNIPGVSGLSRMR